MGTTLKQAEIRQEEATLSHQADALARDQQHQEEDLTHLAQEELRIQKVSEEAILALSDRKENVQEQVLLPPSSFLLPFLCAYCSL